MDSRLKNSNDNGNKPTADDVEAAVMANTNRVFAKCSHFVPVPTRGRVENTRLEAKDTKKIRGQS